ncbi:hypothetical protein B6I21_04545 [candidate division KSB1 bacterium 4572_119]|nr:MAG: hypothetical protein B6I21_04545 [candidate division KSB1 bacterium 4572_119]
MKGSNDKRIDGTLRDLKIRPTKVRKDVLGLFSRVEFALSHADIERHIKQKFDRVTIYRTLEMFEKSGLIHKVIDDTGVTKYASHGYGGCDVHFRHHKTNHLHFKCTECGNIYCMCSVEVPKIDFPIDFELKILKLSAEGICKKCLSKGNKTT